MLVVVHHATIMVACQCMMLRVQVTAHGYKLFLKRDVFHLLLEGVLQHIVRQSLRTYGMYFNVDWDAGRHPPAG